jgi:hypothetical protein
VAKKGSATPVFRCRASCIFQSAWLLIALLAVCAGCSRQTPVPGITPLKAANPAELQKYLLTHRPEVALFRLRGPFRGSPLKDVAAPMSSHRSAGPVPPLARLQYEAGTPPGRRFQLVGK